MFTSLVFLSPCNAMDYFSVSFGQSSVDTGISGLTGTASLDEEDTTFKLLLGKNIKPSISVEGFYMDFGEASLTGNIGDQFNIEGSTYAFSVNNAKVTSSATAFGADTIFLHNFSPTASLYGKLGIVRWDSDFKIAGTGISSYSESDSGIDLFLGFGAKVDVNESIQLAADYEIYDIDDDDVDIISLYLVFKIK